MRDGVNFRYEDDWATIRLADSFVRENKAGTGSGEACLYLGSIHDPNLVLFYGRPDFSLKCVLQRDDLLEYLNSVQDEYIRHWFNYRDEVSEQTCAAKYNEISTLPSELFFYLTRKRQFDKHGRVYAQELEYKRPSNLSFELSPRAYSYDLIRRIAIPEVSYLMFSKVVENGVLQLHARLFYDPESF